MWSAEENERFLEGLRRHGEKGIKEIAEYIGSRNSAQVRSHLQKYKLKNPLPKVVGMEGSQKANETVTAPAATGEKKAEQAKKAAMSTEKVGKTADKNVEETKDNKQG